MGLLGDLIGFLGAGRASGAISQANVAAEHGVLGATSDAQRNIQEALRQAGIMLPAAGETAIGGVNQATGGANQTLADLLGQIQGAVSPYMAAGQAGVQGLQEYAAGKPTFNFAPTMEELAATPGYKFQLEQGTNAIQNSAAARGLGSSGAALKELTNYGQGLAGTYYQNAFNNALSTFNTNQNATLANLTALTGTGLAGTGIYNQATQNLGGQQAQNTVNAGYYGGNVNLSIADLLSKLGMQGATTQGQMGMQGALESGNFATGAGNARAAGILGQGTALTQGVTDIGSLLAQLFPGGG